MRRCRNVLALVAMVYGLGHATPGWSFWATRFADAQAKAAAVGLVRAQALSGQPVHLSVLRVIFGRVGSTDLVVAHPDWFNGSKVVDQHVYLVLLTAENEPYRGDLTSDGVPLYSCGLINALEVVDEQVFESDLYDAKHMKDRAPVRLVDIEREIRQSHGVKDGV